MHEIPRGVFAQYLLMKLHFCSAELLKFDVALQLSVWTSTVILLKIRRPAPLDMKLEDEQAEQVETADRAHKELFGFFGLCPSSGMWKFYRRPQHFGD
jgi:hypothetical protein